ncbi:MAG TPA: BatA domain-containing protein [Flavobacteriales bacterium]|nr:BatA domain-containing protein [Flavobacteriales bacterium]
MSFVYPAFLSAFALLAVPIIIHLFNFKKYKRLFFPDLRFLKEVKEKTKKQSQLKHLLVLLCRILVFSFIVLAFAQPFTGSMQSASPNKVVSIYIDNSFSMRALGKNGPLLDVAKQKAGEMIRSSAQSTRFQILTNEFSPVSQRLYNREEALEQLEGIDVFPVSRNVNEVLARQDEIMKSVEGSSTQLIHISDFQKNSFTYKNTPTNPSLTLIHLKPQTQKNISIDSVWFNSPLHAINGTEEFYFRLRNHNPKEEENVTLQLFLGVYNNGFRKSQKAVTTITVPAGSSVDSSFNYTNTEAGIIHGQLSLNDAQVEFDNQFYFTYEIEPFLQVACINDFVRSADTVSYDIKNIFSNDPYYKFTSFTKQNIDYTLLKQQQFVVLNRLEEISSGLSQELEKFVASGGSVCVIPSLKINLNSYNNFAQTTGSPQFSGLDTNRTISEKPDFDDVFFRGIFEKRPVQLDVPLIRKHYITSGSTRSLTNAILKLKNGSDLISVTKYKKGKVYQVASPTVEQAGNLGQHALFVPIMLRMAELSLTSNKPYYVFGKDAGFEIKPLPVAGDHVFNLEGVETKENIIPEFKNDGNSISIFFNDNLKNSGSYRLSLDGKTVGGTSLNQSRNESELDYFSDSELASILKDAGFTDFKVYDKPIDDSKIELSAIDNTRKYWTTCIWLCLLFLLTESALLKLWKT